MALFPTRAQTTEAALILEEAGMQGDVGTQSPELRQGCRLPVWEWSVHDGVSWPLAKHSWYQPLVSNLPISCFFILSLNGGLYWEEWEDFLK